MLVVAMASLVGCGGDPPPRDTGWETDFEACAEVHQTATFVPVTLFLTVDASGSMDEGDPVSRWSAATEAFTAFFRDPAAGSLGVALRLWPDPDGCDDVSCDPVACAEPQVPAAPLSDPAHQDALIGALEARVPEGYTPLSAALGGAVAWARDRRAAAPDEQAAIVLVTDGEPNGCDEDIGAIAALAGEALAEGAPVFAVGIQGSNEAQLDAIAAAGGTDAGYYLGGSGDVQATLLAALQDIQGEVLGCTFALPEGAELNPDLVRVEYASGGDPVLVPRLSGPAKCEPDGGWYLEDAEIVLCPSSCAEIQAIPGVSLDLAVGCECEVDLDCPAQEVCARNQCVPCEGPACGAGLDGGQAVQGGALICGTAPGSAAWGLALVGLVAAGRRWRRR